MEYVNGRGNRTEFAGEAARAAARVTLLMPHREPQRQGDFGITC
ncbi:MULTISPECIES: hypothetical protein [unclassified Luteimonas]